MKNLAQIIKEETGLAIEHISVWQGRLEIQIKDSKFHRDVEIRYEEQWRSNERNYTVQTTSYGALEPTNAYVAAIVLQAAFLTNAKLIEAAKELMVNAK